MSRQRTLDLVSLLAPTSCTGAAASVCTAGVNIAPYINPGLREFKVYLEAGLAVGAPSGSVSVSIFSNSSSTVASASPITGASFAMVYQPSATVCTACCGTQQTIYVKTTQPYLFCYVVTAGVANWIVAVSALLEKRNPTS